MKNSIARSFSLVLLTLVLLPLASCAWVHRNTVGLFESQVETEASKDTAAVSAASPTEAAPVKIEKLDPIRPPSVDDVEITWKVPEEPVDGFILNYGATRQFLSNEIKIEPNILERYTHPTHGEVFRYILKGIPHSEPLFVSITSFKDTYVSAPSEVMEVK